MTPFENKEKWVTINEAMKRLTVCRSSIFNWMKSGVISGNRINGKIMIYWPSVELAIEKKPHLGSRGRPSKLSILYNPPKPAHESEPLKVKIMSRVMKEEGQSGCWIWIGASSQGQPFFNVYRAERINVRRWVFHQETGELQVGLSAACGRKSCVNPDHQRVGSAKLSISQIESIRTRWSLYLAHKTSHKEIAKEFGVSRQRIEQIVRDVSSGESSR